MPSGAVRAPSHDIAEVSVQTAEELRRAGRALIVDVRQPEEMEICPGPSGAAPLPLLSLKVFAGQVLNGEEAEEAPAPKVISNMALALKELNAARDAGRILLCICRTGQRSREGVALLQSLGYAQGMNVAGGVTAWLEAGLATTTYQQGQGDVRAWPQAC